jgi:hypothetical protein
LPPPEAHIAVKASRKQLKAAAFKTWWYHIVFKWVASNSKRFLQAIQRGSGPGRLKVQFRSPRLCIFNKLRHFKARHEIGINAEVAPEIDAMETNTTAQEIRQLRQMPLGALFSQPQPRGPD